MKCLLSLQLKPVVINSFIREILLHIAREHDIVKCGLHCISHKEHVFFRVHRRICVCRPGQLSRYSSSLRAGRSRDRIPVWARFSAPVQPGAGAHPASYTTGNGSFPGVKRPKSSVDHPSPSSAEVKGRVQLHVYSPSWP
jgi:hypothetical protein